VSRPGWSGPQRAWPAGWRGWAGRVADGRAAAPPGCGPASRRAHLPTREGWHSAGVVRRDGTQRVRGLVDTPLGPRRRGLFPGVASAAAAYPRSCAPAAPNVDPTSAPRWRTRRTLSSRDRLGTVFILVKALLSRGLDSTGRLRQIDRGATFQNCREGVAHGGAVLARALSGPNRGSDREDDALVVERCVVRPGVDRVVSGWA